MSFQKPKGTEDMYSEDQAIENFITQTLGNVAISYGFQEVDTPVMESVELLTAKTSEENTSQIFTFEKRGSENLGLRFDLTVPITRLFVQKQKELPLPVKWFNINKMWRYERPQKGRLREFKQLSIEMFGSPNPEADAEIINLTIDCLKAFGLTKKDFYIRLNNRKLLEGLCKDITDNIDELIALIDKYDKIGEEAFFYEAEQLGIKDKNKLKFVELDDLDMLEDKFKLNKLAKEGLSELKTIYELLDKDFVKISLNTARGLAYYTGTVFEVYNKENTLRAIAGGGRYDNLVKIFKGNDCPATGFGLGFAILKLLLKEKDLLPKIHVGPEYYIAPVSGESWPEANQIASKLRNKTKVSIDLMQRSLKKQLEYASKISAKKVIIIGPDEIKSGKLKVKDLDSGKEEELSIDEI